MKTPTLTGTFRTPYHYPKVPRYWIGHPAEHREKFERRLPHLLEHDPQGVDDFLRAYWGTTPQATHLPGVTRMAGDYEEWPFEVPVYHEGDPEMDDREGHWSEGYMSQEEALHAAIDSGAEGAVYVVEGDDGIWWLWFDDESG